MTAVRIDLDAALRARTRRAMAVSVVAHTLLLAWLVLDHRDSPADPPLTEIVLLDPSTSGSPIAVASAPPAPARATMRGAPVTGPEDVRFRREQTNAELTPTPQSSSAVQDRIAARLATLRTTEPAGVALPSIPTPATHWGGAPATVSSNGTGGSAPIALHRGGSGSAPSLELNRGGGAGNAPATAPVGLPERSAGSAPAGGEDTGARRTLAGASLAGPIANRPIVSWSPPVYPEWAKRDAVEGSVTLYFVVRPDGSVKENVLVQKTAGFEEFDENARAALRAWRFQALGGGRTGEQWGTITFNFRLRDAG